MFAEEAFRDSFLMDWPAVPDTSAYKEKSQYALVDETGKALYRLYLMDGETWLARIHQDSANMVKSEYVWSIYQIARHAPAYSMQATKDGVEAFLALLQGGGPAMYEDDACYNITPEGFAENAGYDIFKFDMSCASYLLYEGDIYPMGEWFGGLGVTSMALWDMDLNGKQELYFTYSFGSGLHRSHAAYFDPVKKRVIPFEYVLLHKDTIVAPNEKGGLSLYEAVLLSTESFVKLKAEAGAHITDIVLRDGEIQLSPMPEEH